jgi:HAMP domain-containing protein
MLRKFEAVLRSLKLGRKFTVLLLLVFLGGIAVSGAVFSTILNYNAQNLITSKAYGMMDTMSSLRDYTVTQVFPELADQFETEYLPEAIPGYSAREVFETLRTNRDYSGYFYKDAMLNPTNLRDKADTFETGIAKRFRDSTNLKELSGFRSGPSGDQFYIARPLAIYDPKCLQCHSTPDRAPKTVIERYGTANGFGWKLNVINGAHIIYVPAGKVFQVARQSFVLVMGIIFVVFAVVILMVNFWLKRYVVRPLNRMSQVAEAVSTGEMEAEFEQTSNDEVGSLAEAFRRMKTSLAIAVKRLEQYSIERRRPDDSQ